MRIEVDIPTITVTCYNGEITKGTIYIDQLVDDTFQLSWGYKNLKQCADLNTALERAKDILRNLR